MSSSDPAKLINTVWDWTPDGKGSKGLIWGTRPAIGSATAANGAAIFNSDFLDNGGSNTGFGKGSSPAPHGADLISPVIDATGKNNLTIVFNQYYRTFDTELTAVTWSEDGGTTWKDTINT